MPGVRRPNEVSSGGVVVRAIGGQWEVCLIRVGAAWSIPKGNLEPGESAEQGALREISEETGLARESLRVEAPLPPSDYVYRRAGQLIFKRVHHFLVVASGVTDLHPDPREVEEAAWVALNHAADRVTYRDLRAALDQAAEVLRTRNA